MRLEKVQEALKTKKIIYEYTEENGCGSIDFMFRGLRSIYGNMKIVSGERRQTCRSRQKPGY